MLNRHDNGRDSKGAEFSDSGAQVHCRIIHLNRGVGGGKICRGMGKFLLTHAKFESLWKNNHGSC